MCLYLPTRLPFCWQSYFYLSVSSFLCLFAYLSVYLYLSIFISVRQGACPCACPSKLRGEQHLHFCLYICSVSACVVLSFRVPAYLSVCLVFCLSVSACLFVCPPGSRRVNKLCPVVYILCPVFACMLYFLSFLVHSSIFLSYSLSICACLVC